MRNLADAAILYTLQMAAESPDLILQQSPTLEMITVEENPLASTLLNPPHQLHQTSSQTAQAVKYRLKNVLTIYEVDQFSHVCSLVDETVPRCLKQLKQQK